MRIITIEKNLYTWDELSQDAKDRVTNRFNGEHNWGAEYLASLKTFADHFGVRVTDWSYGPWSSAEVETDATPAHFRGFTLRQARALPEYPTGYCADYTLRDVFVREFERTGDAHRAFIEAMDAGIKEAREDWEYQFSEDYMTDLCAANGYEFDERGNLQCRRAATYPRQNG